MDYIDDVLYEAELSKSDKKEIKRLYKQDQKFDNDTEERHKKDKRVREARSVREDGARELLNIKKYYDKKIKDVDNSSQSNFRDSKARTASSFIGRDNKKKEIERLSTAKDKAMRSQLAKTKIIEKQIMNGKGVYTPSRDNSYYDDSFNIFNRNNAINRGIFTRKDMNAYGNRRYYYNNIKYQNESVNDLKLRVYDAYENGLISESDKSTYLNLLDTNNYN
jgi:hypothetical protein